MRGIPSRAAVSRPEPPRGPPSRVAGVPRAGPGRLVPAPRPGRARRRGEPPKAKNCILIWLAGGPSHLDTFDPKPDATADVRGEFKPIATSVPGLCRSARFFPNLAKVMDRVTLIRSMTSPESDHDRAAHHLLTGYRPSPALVYPGYGSVVAKAREATRGMLPPLRRGSRRPDLRPRAAI